MALNAALNEGKLQYTEDHQPAAAASKHPTGTKNIDVSDDRSF